MKRNSGIKGSPTIKFDNAIANTATNSRNSNSKSNSGLPTVSAQQLNLAGI